MFANNIEEQWRVGGSIDHHAWSAEYCKWVLSERGFVVFYATLINWSDGWCLFVKAKYARCLEKKVHPWSWSLFSWSQMKARHVPMFLLLKAGYGLSAISRQLIISRQTVFDIKQKWQEWGTIQHKKDSDSPQSSCTSSLSKTKLDESSEKSSKVNEEACEGT